ncbi:MULTISPECIES: TonB-dependent receptor [unclassified Imperialibacter]|uniref:TonB-dependent receptor n=1 Tax=unclassified Imperialibacter TaxID=2629706 RepID=UPI0012528781|nr:MULTISPECIES: TonB-dependent receptor [unclassified Imperialibacter]CAD5290781.1 TonB-dependent receptor [Imperialibacter sp. 89]CAD5291042.1 TonB-dependent receptor [Imperialibacter sp. 75]VVT34428.1 TonB-dependent receptor [Imperialibacter sp. EC-SDR9]
MKKAATLLLIIGLGFHSQAQNPTITAIFSETPFDQAVKTIEEQAKTAIFYNPQWTDTLRVNATLNSASLREALTALIPSASDLSFFINSGGKVIISKGYVVRESLPVDFFTREPVEDKMEVAALELEKTRNNQGPVEDAIENKTFEVGKKTAVLASGKATVAGYVKSMASGEPVIGALVYIENPKIGTITDQFGYYSLTIPNGKQLLKIQNVGMKSTRRQIILYADGLFNIEMEEDVVALKEVVIEAERDVNVTGMQMGLDRLDIQSIKQMPSAFGEADIMKVALTLPGVQSVGEGSNGFNVRGGSTSQNLILLNDAVIYNPSHLFGFFTAFNADVVRNVELHKAGIPAEYGGRISSVFEVDMKDGNKKKFAGSGGIGLVTGRLSLEGPIIEDKASFLIAGRSSYSDWILKRLPNATFKNSTAGFNDLNARVTYDIDEKNSVYITGYLSNDKFSLNSDSLYQYTNSNASIKWKKIFNSRLYGVFTGVSSHYDYSLSSEDVPVNAFNLGYGINQHNFKADFSYFPESMHKIDFGLSSIYYDLSPGFNKPVGDQSILQEKILEKEKGIESAIYVGDKVDVNDKLSVYLGLRYSMYSFLGPKSVIQYDPTRAKDVNTMQDTVQYPSGDFIKTYHGPEYRASMRYAFNPISSAKLSFNRMRQYIHQLSNTQAISPTDIWKLSDSYISPQIGDQFSIGYYRNMRSNSLELSVETYYKWLTDMLDYKNGAVLVLNEHLETDVIKAKGKAYGLEIMLKKKTGKLNGWVSYTYSRTLVQIAGQFPEERVNRGTYFPASYDKPHDLTIVSNYKFTRRINISVNYTYSTGRPITYPLSVYTIGGANRVHYSDRNAYRIPDYSRMDLSINFEGNHKIKKLAHSSWTFALFNVLGRNNVYSIYFVTEQGEINGYKLSVFARPIPTITYNFRF